MRSMFSAMLETRSNYHRTTHTSVAGQISTVKVIRFFLGSGWSTLGCLALSNGDGPPGAHWAVLLLEGSPASP